jgi:hypothetical protein
MTSYESYRFGHSQALMSGARVYHQIYVLCALGWWTRHLRPFLPALEAITQKEFASAQPDCFGTSHAFRPREG